MLHVGGASRPDKLYNITAGTQYISRGCMPHEYNECIGYMQVTPLTALPFLALKISNRINPIL